VLGAFDVLCLPALRAFDHVKLYLLSFLKAAEAVRLDGGEMYEYILAVLAADKSIALSVVKPLHCSCFHVDAMFLFVDVALKLSDSSAGRSRAGLSGDTGYCEELSRSNAALLYEKRPRNATQFVTKAG
jgi:hypothetical protein